MRHNLGHANSARLAAGPLSVLVSLAFLVGCQGLSGGSNQQTTPSDKLPVSTLSFGSTSVSFGDVAVGSTKGATLTATNSGSSSVTITSVTISSQNFLLTSPTLPVTLPAGQNTAIGITFSPNAAEAFNATATVSSDASNATANIPLNGSGTAAAPAGQLGPNPTSLSFGSVTIGNEDSLSETITNTGGTSVTISQIAVSGAGFGISGVATPLTLAQNQSAAFTVTFDPASSGSASGTVTVTSNASNSTLALALSGTGTTAIGQLSVTPTTLGIGNVVVGTSGTASGSLTATGANVTLTAANSTNSVFSVSGLSLPVTITAGQGLPFTVTFSPTATGAASATLDFTSNAQTTTTAEALTGTGTAPPTYSVNLSWTASTSPDISGYNVYRAVYASSCGSFSKINPSLNTTTLYTDSVVIDGTNYCYATTAVNSSNEESGYSNVVSNVQIPAP